MTQRTEAQRAERAFRALLQAQYTEGGSNTIEEAVCDLMTDLIHLSKEYNFDAAEVLARAQGHAEAEDGESVTGRLSSNELNLQNIPVRTAEGRKVREARAKALESKSPT